MDILNLSIRNCLTIAKADLELDNRGLLLVQGENADDTSASSNGAGKSSLLDALCWCLYGTTARDVTGDDVVNRKAKKDCEVSVTLDDAGTVYLIKRYRKHATHKNQLFVWQIVSSGTNIDLSKGTDKETQDVVNKIMGCSLDVFVGAIYAGQEKMPDLPGMTDKQLKLIVEEAAGVEELAEAYTEARSRSLKIEGDLKAMQATVNATESNLNGAKRGLELLEAEHDAFEAGRKDRARAELVKVKAAEEGIVDAKFKLGGYDKPTLEARKTALEAELANRTMQEAELAKLEGVVRAADRRTTSLRANIDTEKRRIDKQKQDLADIDTKVGTPCGECGKGYCEHDLEGAKKAQSTNIAAAIANLRTNVEEYKKAQAELTAAQASADKFRSEMTDVSAASKELSAINSDLIVIGMFERSILQLEKDIVTIKATAKAKLTEPNPYVKTVAGKKEEVDKLELELSRRQADLAELSEKQELYADAVKVFGPAGVRAHILDTVTPFLNERTGEYLGALADGNIHAVWSTLAKTAKGDLKEKFNIDVVHDKGGETFKALSGGEKRKVRIATAMALQDMVASRASKPINLLMCDEIDHALDEPGLERLMTVLEKKARDRGTVLIVSHNSLSDWCDQVIYVKKSGGLSSVSGATIRGM